MWSCNGMQIKLFQCCLITNLRDYEKRMISRSNWKSHLRHSRRFLIMLHFPNKQTYQIKCITEKLWIPMNHYMVLIGALKWRGHPYLDAIPLWETWLNIWWLKWKGCLKEQLTKFLVFFIMMPCHWWHQSKLLSGLKKKILSNVGLDGVHPKTSHFSTRYLISVNCKVVSQLSQPIFV